MPRRENKNRKLVRVLDIMIMVVITILIICTILTTKWVNDIKIMTTDSLNTLNDINVQAEEIKTAVDPNEALINHYSQLLPMEYCLYVVRTAEEYEVNPKEIFAVMEKESDFDPGAISSTGDYGLMQINISNLPAINKALGTTDLLDPYQNIEAGIYWYAGIKANNHETIEQDLMVYNMGSRGASRQWEKGVYSTDYRQDVIDLMQ